MVRQHKLPDKVRSAGLGKLGITLDKCWPLSRQRHFSDVSRMPDEDLGQLCTPCWAKQLTQ